MVDEQTLRRKLAELAELVASLPRGGNPDSSSGNYVSHAAPPAGRSAEDLLDHLRLQLTYLTFDLEATRRENKYLRQMLERRSNLGDGPENF